MKKILFIWLVCMGSFFSGQAQNVFNGRVTDEYKIPLAGVSLSADKTGSLAMTDSAGHFSFSHTGNAMLISCSHVGYQTMRFNLSTLTDTTIILLKDKSILPEATVYSFEQRKAARSIPAAVTVLEKDLLNRYSPSSLVSALNTVPGVKMDERSPGSYRISIRGNLLRSTFGVRNVKIYWNGIPFTDANGNSYINELSPLMIDRIEILKGPSGSMYGAGTGGVMLMNTEATGNPGKQLQLQLQTGSDGLFSAHGAYHQSNASSANKVSFTHQQSGGYRDQTSMRRDVVHYTGDFFSNKRQSLHANVFYSDLYYQTPGALTAAERDKDPRQARPAVGIFPGAVSQQAALYLKTMYAGLSSKMQWGSSWNSTNAIYLSHTQFKNPTIRNFESKTERSLGLRSVWQYRKKILTVTFGGEYQFAFTNTSTFGNKAGVADTLQYNDEIGARQYNVFVQADVKLHSKLVLNAGISYNRFHYGFTRVGTLLNGDQSSDFKPQFVPRIALLGKISSGVNAYVSVSKGYSPPSIDEVHASDGLFNTSLNAEYALNYEAGIKGQLANGKISFDACMYWLGLRETIVSRRNAGGADYYVNAGKTKQRGIETAWQYRPVDRKTGAIRQLMIGVNYTHLNARFTQYQQGAVSFDGNQLTGTVPDMVSIQTNLISAAGLYANLQYAYTGKTVLNDANSFFADAYQLLFVKLGYKVHLFKKVDTEIFMSYDRSLNGTFSLGNDLNAAANRYFNPSAPRNLQGGLLVKISLR